MAICLKCGKQGNTWLCNSCRNEVDIEQLFCSVLAYNPGIGENPLWDRIAAENTDQYGFRSIALDLTELMGSPRKEYCRMLALAGKHTYFPKAERDWLYHFYQEHISTEKITEEEKTLIKGFVISALVADYRYAEAEKLTEEVCSSNDIPTIVLCIIGDFYTKTRRYEKADQLLRTGLEKATANEDDKKRLEYYIQANTERAEKAKAGKQEYIPKPKDNAEFARYQYISFMNSIGIKVVLPVKAPKPIPDDIYPDIPEIRKPDFDSFVAFDFETTGIDARRDSIIQVGAVRVVDGAISNKEEDKFVELVKPYKKTVSETITELTGIRQEDVQNARQMWEVIPEFLEFVGDSILVGYNSVNFDARFLRRAGRYSHKEIDNPVFDVMRYAGMFKEQLGLERANASLIDLAEQLGIEAFEAHDAYNDAYVTAKAFLELKKIERERTNQEKNQDANNKGTLDYCCSQMEEKEFSALPSGFSIDLGGGNLNPLKSPEEQKEKDKAELQAEALAKMEAEIKARVEEETLRKEKELARMETEMRARIDAEMKARQEALAKMEAEMKERMDAEVKARADALSKMEEQMRNKVDKATEQKVYGPKADDPNLAVEINKAFNKLEAYYPEHKIFAFDSIDGTLREKMAKFYRQLGYTTITEMFDAYEYEVIAGKEVSELRSFVMYSPGDEPDIIKSKVDSVINQLEEYYPEHTIYGSLQKQHKKLASRITGLYQWLGYSDAAAMLEAYGFDYITSERTGRPTNDYEGLINTLIERYKDTPKPRSMGELIHDNADIKGAIKTLQNKSTEVFGMTLMKYLQSVGVFENKGAVSKKTTSIVTGVQDNAYRTLKKRYEQKSMLSDFEEAIRCLENMNVKQNREGKVYVFRGAEGKEEIVIPYGIDFISSGAFRDRGELKSVKIEAQLEEIPAEAFSNCASLEKIGLPNSLILINSDAFENCMSLKHISLPASLQQVASRAFAGCSSLENVEILNAYTVIADTAFNGCKYEHHSFVEEGATDEEAFSYAIDKKGNVTITGLKREEISLSIPGMIEGHPVTTIGKGAFQNCNTLEHVFMPDVIRTIQGAAFKDCSNLRTVHLSNSISKLVSTTFRGCDSLEEINLPDALTEVIKLTFVDSRLKKLHIGKSLNAIDPRAFFSVEYDNYSGKMVANRRITDLTIDPDNQNFTAMETVVLSKDKKALVIAMRDTGSVVIPEGIEQIGEKAFEGFNNLTDISFPDSLIKIGKNAFSYSGLRRVEIGREVRKIEKEAFAHCQQLTSIVFNNKLEEIEENAFLNSPVFSVYLPASLRKIGDNCFNCIASRYGYYNPVKKQELIIDPENPYWEADGKALYSLEEDGKTLRSFYGFMDAHTMGEYGYGYFDEEDDYDEIDEDHSYIVRDGTKHIAEYAFANNNRIQEVVLPEGLISIGSLAFDGCTFLKHVVLPNSIKSIGEDAFRGTAVKVFELGSELEEIGAGAFAVGGAWHYQDLKIANIYISSDNPVLHVDKKALYKKRTDGAGILLTCFSDDSVVEIPEGVTEICKEAFKRSLVEEVRIPYTVKRIGENAFEDCAILKRIRIGFDHFENGVNHAVLYIPEDVRDVYGIAQSSIHQFYMDCIRIAGEEELFDFIKYDSLFEGIPRTKDKILVATDRLKSAIRLIPQYHDQYLSFLRKNAEEAVKTVIEYDDVEGIAILAELDVFTGENIDQVIELANRTKKTDTISYLMNYKNAKIGIADNDPLGGMMLE